MPKQKKDRERGRHPTPDPSKQQQAEELSLNSALKFESAQDLARYLRGNQEVDQFVLQSVKQTLDKGELRVRYSRRGRPAKKLRRLPSSGPEEADLIDPTPGSQMWIKPARHKRRLRKPSQRAHQRAICLQIEEARVKERGNSRYEVSRLSKSASAGRTKISIGSPFSFRFSLLKVGNRSDGHVRGHYCLTKKRRGCEAFALERIAP